MAPADPSPRLDVLTWKAFGLALAGGLMLGGAPRAGLQVTGALLGVGGTVYLWIGLRRHRQTHLESLSALPLGGPVETRLQELPRAWGALEAKIGELSRQLDQEDNLRWNLLANLRAGVLLFRQGGRLRLYNPSARQLLGSSSHVAVGASLADVFREPESLQNLESALKGASPEWILNRQGRVMEIRAVPLRAMPPASDDTDGILVTVHDITRQEALETTRQKFISNASHELKTPTTSIRVAAENLLEGGMVQHDGEIHLRIILRAVDRMTMLLHDISELSRIETGALTLAPVPLSMGPFVEDLLEDCATQATERQVRLSLDLPEHLAHLTFQADPHRLHQLLENLLSNAIKFSPAESEVTLHIRREEDTLVWAVEDQGMGISASELSRIFERFYRTPAARAVPGTGLGLAIVKHLALLMHGEVLVDSIAGKGSTFTLRLPL